MVEPAQAAVAKAVMDYVAEGILSQEVADNLMIIVSVFIQWDAKDKKKVYEYNYRATELAGASNQRNADRQGDFSQEGLFEASLRLNQRRL